MSSSSGQIKIPYNKKEGEIMQTLTPEYITKGELEMRMGFSDQKTEILISSMKEVLDERLDKMQAIVEKNLAEHRAITSEIRTDIREMQGENRLLSTRLDGLEKRIDDMNANQSKWFTLLGVLVAAVPIAIAIIQNFMMK